MLGHIRWVHRENRCAYGAIKTWQEVCGQGIGCGKHRVAHLRRQARIQAQRRRRFRITVENHHSLPPGLKSFFSNLKNELVHHCDFASREQARAAIFDYIELFYNRQRRHQALDYVSPAQFEQQGGVA
ncbi:MAG: IS3 family transposase [Betaproteobacteria bacterium]